MNPQEVNELYKIWTKFMSTTKSEEGEVWLDIFLSKYLESLSKRSTGAEPVFSFVWMCSGNILAHQLLSDVYQICETAKSLVSEQSEDDDPQISELFKQYILCGRGWKLLWTLENIGIQKLPCLTDLVKLLIVHFPVIMTLPVGESNIPESLRRTPSSLPLDVCFEMSKKGKQASFASACIKHDFLTLRKRKFYHVKKRMRKKTYMSNEKSEFSNSDEDRLILEPCIIPATQLRTLQRTVRRSSIPHPDLVSEKDESGYDGLQSDSVSLNYSIKDLECYSISVTDYVSFIINLFQDCVLLDKKGVNSCSFTSPSILEFSLMTLQRIHTGHYKLEGWTQNVSHDLQSQLLRLVFLSTTVTINCLGDTGVQNENETLSSLFVIAPEILFPPCGALSAFSNNDLNFTCDILIGTFMLVQNTVLTCDGNYAKVICIIRTFTTMEGLSMCCNVIPALEIRGDNQSEKRIASMLSLIKDIVLQLKYLRAINIGKRRFDDHRNSVHVSELAHHENNLFGPPVSHSVMNPEPMCCVATMSSLLLKVFSFAQLSTTLKEILKHIKACGICCCVDSSVVFKTFFNNFSCYDGAIQHGILALFEKCLLSQLGLRKSQCEIPCNYCFKRIGESDILNFMSSTTTLEKSSLSVLQRQKDNTPFWNMLSMYNDMLNITVADTIKLVALHLTQLFEIGIESLKIQLFFRVILPQFLLCNSKSELTPVDYIKIDCFLSVLPSALVNFSVTSAFISCGGMPILYHFAMVPEFMMLTFSVIEILITSEYLNMKNKPDLIISPSVELSHLQALSMFSDFLFEHTSVSVIQLRAYVHNLNVKSEGASVSIDYHPNIVFLSDIWATFNELSQKLETHSMYKLGSAAVGSAFTLIVFLLENFCSILSAEDKHQKKTVSAENILSLLRNLVGMFLKAPEEITLQEDFLNTLKQTLIHSIPDSIGNITLLLDLFLKCSLVSSTLPRLTRKPEEKKSAQGGDMLDDFLSSDKEHDGFLSNTDSYAGDSEESYNAFSNVETDVVSSINPRVIEHGHIVKFIIELIVDFQDSCVNHWAHASSYILPKILKLCEDCKANTILLCQMEIPMLLLKGFSESLKLNDDDLKDFQKFSLELFTTLAQHSVEVHHLKQIISFFKDSNAPMDCLLQCLNDMADSTISQPVHSLAFPVMQSSSTLPTLKMKKRMKGTLSSLASHAFGETEQLLSPSPSCWCTAAVLCPLTEDSNWNAFKKGFSYMLWVELSHTESKLRNGVKLHKKETGHLKIENDMLHIASIGSHRLMFELWCVKCSGDIVIRISVYNDGTVMCLSEASVKSWLKHGSWQHLALNYSEVIEKSICNCKVRIVLNGVKESVITLKFRSTEAKSMSELHLLLGHSLTKSEENIVDKSYRLGSFMFFKEELARDEIFYFSSLGPDVTNITDCAVQKCQQFPPKNVNYENLSTSISSEVLSGLKVPSLKQLQNALLCIYMAEKPNEYLLYPHNARGTFSLRMTIPSVGASRFSSPDDMTSYQTHPTMHSVLSLANLNTEEIYDFQHAVQRVGGITIFIFLFAYTLETSDTGKNQAAALQLLLKLINKNTVLYEDFMRVKGDDLLFQLISNNCSISMDFLEVLLNNCLNQHVMKKNPSSDQVSIDSEPNLVITNPQIYVLMVKSILFAENTSDDVLSLLFTVMDKLLCTGHPNLNFNIRQITSVETLGTILWYLKKKYLSAEGRPFSANVAKKIPPLIERLLNCKFDVLVFQSICHFLVLLHKASATFVCHSRSAFFFLFPQNSFGAKVHKLSASALTKGRLPYLQSPGSVVESQHDLTPQLTRSPSYHGENFFKQISTKADCSLSRRVSSETCILSLDDSNRRTSSDITSSDENSTSVEKDRMLMKARQAARLSSDLRSNSFSSDSGDIVELCTGFLNLIQNILLKVSQKVLESIMTFLQPEIFLILAYNINADVRSSSIKVIHSYLQFASTEKLNEFISMKGFHLLSNQLHELQPDLNVIDACFKLASGHSALFNFNSFFIEGNLSATQVLSWIPIFALLPAAYNNVSVCRNILSYLNIVLHQANTSVCMELINNGLFEFISKFVFNIAHSSQRKDTWDLFENNVLLGIIENSINFLTKELFSSKQPGHFTQLQNMLNLFTALERRCTRDCGCDSQCVTAFRVCQCILYMAALRFSKFYYFDQMNYKGEGGKEEKKYDWDTLTDIPVTFPGFISVSKIDIILDSESLSEADPNSPSSPSSELQKQSQQGIDKAKHDLSMSEMVARLQIVLSTATDFIVFKDLGSKIAMKEEEFFKVLFGFAVKGLTSAMDKNRGSSNSKWISFMWSLKDCLKIQISRLLLSSLAFPQNANQREFTLEVLANHPMCKKILHLVIFSMSKASNLLLFLHDLQKDSNVPTPMKKNLVFIYSIVKDLLHDVSCISIVSDDALFEKLKAKWPQLWNQDRWKWLAMTNSTTELALQSKEKLAQSISVSAMDVTKKVLDIQNVEWKKFVEERKLSYYEEASLRRSWCKLSEHMTHERASWHLNDFYPISWELDPTEGPCRIRRRLRRCHLNVEPRFLMPQFEEKLLSKKKKVPFVGLLENHCGFTDSAAVIHKLHSNEQIEYNCPCKVITAFEEAKAEILIGDCCLHIIGERNPSSFGENVPLSETCPFNCIKEILLRRFELQNYAFEIFMNNGLTFLIAFQSEKDLENIWKRLEEHGLPCRMSSDVHSITQLWRDGTITNFEYITQLNKLSGRSFNDLMQYPVFPFILADYASSYIDLNDSQVYRNFCKPAAIQHKYREQYFTNTYDWLREQTSGPFSDSELPFSSPYHYGSHYSNSGTVLSFLIRLLPFTYGFISYQDNNFDIPDRTFHSMQTSWELVTKHSTSDVKELIPEFFFLPEFLCNREGFDFGVRQTGVRVNDILLPPWSKQNSRLFILIHRQALESDVVANGLHNWIDLVFGYKQTGEAAINAINVFHPATYFGLDTEKWKDPITRQAVKAMIKTIGQMPRQLFLNPHPMISMSLACLDQLDQKDSPIKVIDTVDGLKWGNYVGSPSTGNPSLVWRRRQSITLGSFLTVLTNDVFGLGQNICLLLNHRKDDGPSITSATYILSAALVSWDHKDGIVRIKLCRDQPAIPLLKGSSYDPVCLCASVPDCKYLFVAHVSGKILIYDLDIDSLNHSVSENNPPLQLSGHYDAITSIFISKAFSIFVTSGKDEVMIVWDLNRLNYVRSILDHKSSVKLVCVSNTLGDIASVSHSDEGSCLKIHTINGELVGSVQILETVTALCYSTAPEGISVNVVGTGLHTGTIRLWSSWDLKPVREIKSDKFLLPIKCLTFSVDNQHLYAANKEGTVAVWEKPSKGLTTVPRLLLFT